jgi:hypothetical protein
MRMRVTEVTAVHEEEGLELLELLGVRDLYQTGDLVCAVCGSSLRDRGIGAATRQGDGFQFACSQLDCLEEFHTT